ncbi:cation:proton antiporter [Pendulispora albinea]|uniref:Cation:proton antiporter n=1 Tax=Pendulispora albinea TaxID=2741071 RepID=A0ABZ2LNG8_9BACT
MTEHDAVVFLAALAALLGVARLLGELARLFGMPLVVGEILAGVLLGPTVLGRALPGVHGWLFLQPTPQKMIGAYTTVGVVLLLVVAGLEVDLGIVRRRGRSAFFTSVLGIVLPLAGGLLLGFMLPASDMVHADQRVLFAMFIGVALSISALPVIAKTLLDLGLFKTDLGLLVMAAAMINDLVGWIAFSMLVGPMQGNAVDVARLVVMAALSLVFIVGTMTVGRRAIDRLLGQLADESHGGRVLSLVILFALVGASITQALGIHAVLGGFVVGVAIGDSPSLRERTRATIHEFVTNVFAPVFFASLGLRVDFLRAFDLRLCVLVFVIATVAKVVGCSVGARAGGLRWRESMAVGFGLNARGAMEIILALLALEAGLLKEQLFVALVVMALGTSLIGGPAMKRLLYRATEEDVVALLRRGGFVPRLASATATGAIEELVRILEPRLGHLATSARTLVLEREQMAPTGLGDEVAVPHAAIEGLEEPMLALGLAPEGVDFDAPDGKPATIVFLLLLAPGRYEEEVRVLASIARSVIDSHAREQLMDARETEQVLVVLAESARRIAEERRARGPALADI